ncbi:hypothetical protein MKW94_007663, partial [Papaver nudicaule]|nr:hypothetical protein [Papaver nudicaule]
MLRCIFNHVDSHLFYVSFLLLISLNASEAVTSSSSSSSSSPSTVKYLPGFSGPLPFHLETGYISVSNNSVSNSNDGDEDVELFYYFVKSERKPEEDPIVFWFTGGPVCSSLSGLLFEIGPLNIDEDGYVGGLPNLVLNKYSWTK